MMDIQNQRKYILDKLIQMENPVVVHHYDADGITAGAIIFDFLKKKRKDVELLGVNKLTSDIVKSIKDRNVVFVDLGSNCKEINNIKGNVVIIDHHEINHVNVRTIFNPRMFGIDGDSELCSAMSAYYITKNRGYLAIIGGIGDIQYPFKGINNIIEKEILNGKTLIKKIYDLGFYGYFSRTIFSFLYYNDSPYIKGLSFNSFGIKSLLNELKIDENESYGDLEENLKKKIRSKIIQHIITTGQYNILKEIFKPIYLIQNVDKRIKDARNFSTLLNAVGRYNRLELAIRIALLDKQAIEEGFKILEIHKKRIKEGIRFAMNNIQDLDSFYLVDGRKKINANVIGSVCGMLIDEQFNKPIVGIAINEENKIKISIRANKKIVKKIDLGNIINEIKDELHILGGGHSIAAGAEIDEAQLDGFLKILSLKLRHGNS